MRLRAFWYHIYMTRNIVLFTRDLRLVDNALVQTDAENIACFILDSQLLLTHHNQFAMHFLRDSLEDLASQLRSHHSCLHIEAGQLAATFTKFVKRFKPDTVSMSRDFTPYGLQREAMITRLCTQHKITPRFVEQHTLLPLSSVAKADGTPYRVFTPFYHAASEQAIPHPAQLNHATWIKSDERLHSLELLGVLDRSNIQPGGRAAALKILAKPTRYQDYAKERDYPALNATTHLSAHLHWGTVSAREVYWRLADQLGVGHALIRQLFWREFYYTIAYHFPHVWQHNFDKRFDRLHWEHDLEGLKAWQVGQTGFPIVDAAMRCMNATGAMHNRNRMITASFLVKDLGINWREGESYFASKLIDYDKTLNNGNWQWVAGTGVDAAPYFRVFNPWLQQIKFDPEAAFIRQWLRELEGLPTQDIHDAQAERPDYPRPILDHTLAAQTTIARYKRVS